MAFKARSIDPLTIKVPEHFRTARLCLRKPSPAMAGALASARSESDASLLPWFHDDVP